MIITPKKTQLNKSPSFKLDSYFINIKLNKSSTLNNL